MVPGIASAADCVPSVPVGDVVGVTVTTHNSDRDVTYATGYLDMGKRGWSGTLSELLSGLIVRSGRLNQPFDASHAYQLGVMITGSPGRYMLTLSPWAATPVFSVAAHCDGPLLQADFGYGGAFVDLVISFGTPQPPPQ
jgi:hypothetical protein